MTQTSAHCHKMIRDVAQAMAHEVYDELMKDNEWYKIWKKKNYGASQKALEERFVRAVWPGLIEQARATLAQMLSGPLDANLKDQIYEALLLDNTLIYGRQNPSRVLN